VSPDDKERRGPGSPGPGGRGRDLDALKAKLGLGRPDGAPAEGARKEAADDFRFSFGEAGGEAPSLSPAELAAIEDEVQRAAKPFGRKVVLGVVFLILTVLLLWLGYHFGKNMGLRTLHNEAVGQAQGIKNFFLKSFADKTGRELASRRDATSRFIDTFEQFHEERFAKVAYYVKTFQAGKYPPDWDFEKMKKEELEPMKTLCRDFLTNVEEYAVASILKGQLYSTELGAKLLDFVDRSNKLRSRVEALYVAIELIETYQMSGVMPSNLKPEVLLFAEKAEKETDKIIAVKEVEVSGTPELDKELETKEICEPIAIELEIPVCGARKGEPEFEKRLLDTYQKSETQLVKQFKKVTVKDKGGKAFSARFQHLFKIDLKGHLVPLLERISGDKRVEALNLGMLFSTFFLNMSDVRLAGEAVDFRDVLDAIEKYGGQELFFTF